MNTSRFAVVACCLFVLSISTVYAAGGGGGGGGGGSFTTGGPQYDPTEDYGDGISLVQEGNYKKAVKKFRAVLKAVPRHAQANFYMGVAKYGLEDYKGAVRYYKRAVKYDKEMYRAYEQLGRSYLARGKNEDAQAQLDVLEQALQTCGEDCSKYRLKTAYNALKQAMDKTAGVENGQQGSILFEPVSDQRASYMSAVEYINAGRFEHAIDELDKLSAVVGPHPDVLNYLGFAHRKLGRFSEALEYYRQALAVAPMHRGANEYLGELYVEIGEPDKAKARLGVLARACPFGCAEYEDLKRRIEEKILAVR